MEITTKLLLLKELTAKEILCKESCIKWIEMIELYVVVESYAMQVVTGLQWTDLDVMLQRYRVTELRASF